MEIGRITPLTATTTSNPINDWESVFINLDAMYEDYCELLDYEDYRGIAQQIWAEELGFC